MDKGSYTYKNLGKKYGGFLAPSFEVEVDGSTLDRNKMPIPSLEVEIAGDGTAGGCTFSIQGIYDLENGVWKNNAMDTIQPGAKLVVRGGYASAAKKELFYGYIDEYTLDFSPDGIPTIHVGGLDALGFLMSMREPIYAGKEGTQQIVKTILGKGVSAGYAKSTKVGSLSGFEMSVVKEDVDDWKFLNIIASRYGVSLMVVDGELIFDNLASSTSPILTFSLQENLHSFRKRVSLAHQVGKVEVRGLDVNHKAVKGEASSVTGGGSGDSAAELSSKLKDAVLREYNEYVRTDEECKTLAQNRLNAIAMNLVSGEGVCVGIPELIPGRYVKIEGGDSKSNGSYFVTKVRHIFNEDGYMTTFEFKGSKA